MPDPVDFAGRKSLWVSPDCFPITPDDDADLPTPVRAIRAGTGGDVTVETSTGQTRVMAFLDGETRYVAINKVFATGTTASDLEGMM